MIEFDQLITLVKEQLGSNDFFKGGFLLAVLGASFAYLRNTPLKIWNRIKYYSIITVIFTDKDRLFDYFIDYFDRQKITARKTNLRIRTFTERYDPEKNESMDVVPNMIDNRCEYNIFQKKEERQHKKIKMRLRVVYGLGMGSHYVKYDNFRMFISRGKDEEGGGGGAGGSIDSIILPQSLSIKFFRWNRKKFHKMIEDIYKIHLKDSEDLIHYHNYNTIHGWSYIAGLKKRPLSTVMLKEGQKKEIVGKIDDFLDKEDIYIKQGRAWQFGIGLEGPAGTGKTSLVTGLASHFNYDVALLALGDSTMKDEHVREAFTSLPPNCFLLIEDIDSFFGTKKDKRKSKVDGVTFSNLINCINGVISNPGRILFVTSNYMRDMDDALIRKGRIDYIFTLNECDEYQAQAMFVNFFPDSDSYDHKAFGKKGVGHTPGDLQQHLLDYEDDVKGAISNPIVSNHIGGKSGKEE